MTKPNRPTVRLFVEEELREGQALVLSEGPSHYLRTVLRKSEGAVVGLFNGQSPEFAATLVAVGKKAVTVEIGAQVAAFEPVEPLTLMFSPIKRTPMEWVIAKATELGISDFQPVLMDHTQSDRMKAERLEAIAIEAAEQSERLTIPRFHAPMKLREAVEDCTGVIGVAVETSGFEPVVKVLEKNTSFQALMIGPEGGFSPDEVAWLATQEGVVGLGLGPRILKAETASIALISLYQAIKGDWYKHPDFRASVAP